MLTPRKMYPRAVNVALSQEMYDRLGALRGATGATLPAVIRAAVEYGLPRLEREVAAAADPPPPPAARSAARPAPGPPPLAVGEASAPAPTDDAPDMEDASTSAAWVQPDAALGEDDLGADQELGREIAAVLGDGEDER